MFADYNLTIACRYCTLWVTKNRDTQPEIKNERCKKNERAAHCFWNVCLKSRYIFKGNTSCSFGARALNHHSSLCLRPANPPGLSRFTESLWQREETCHGRNSGCRNGWWWFGSSASFLCSSSWRCAYGTSLWCSASGWHCGFVKLCWRSYCHCCGRHCTGKNQSNNKINYFRII